MKDLLLLAVLISAGSLRAQEQPVRTITPQPAVKQGTAPSAPVKLYKMQPAPGTIVTNETDSLAGETIAHCDAMIAAIDTKVAYVQSDQSMSERAQASGWFEKMAGYRAKYAARKEALLQREEQH